MLISTRGRYALRVMADLAENGKEEYIPLKEIAARENISQKYVEAIMTELSKAGLVDALHGKGGGYRLKNPPEECTLRSVLEVTEGSLAPVSCLEKGENSCERKDVCKTLPMWEKLNELIYGFFDGITLKDLL